MDKVLEKIISDVADKYQVDKSEVEKVLIMPYKFMREKITKLELRGKEYNDVKDQKTNFNMPVLFKMYLNEYKLNYFKKLEDDKQKDCSGADI